MIKKKEVVLCRVCRGTRILYYEWLALPPVLTPTGAPLHSLLYVLRTDWSGPGSSGWFLLEEEVACRNATTSHTAKK